MGGCQLVGIEHGLVLSSAVEIVAVRTAKGYTRERERVEMRVLRKDLQRYSNSSSKAMPRIERM